MALDYYEFFAGGGMARLGLGAAWRCLLSNDFCPKKAHAYRRNFPPAREFICRDVAKLTLDELTGRPLLAWASFPCQDLSLAGCRKGLHAERSGTFWPFWRLIQGMAAEGRPVPLVAIENVVGALSSNRGADFESLLSVLSDGGYVAGALVADAAMFVPQSRPRLFIVAVRKDQRIPEALKGGMPGDIWHPNVLTKAFGALPGSLKRDWVWWRLLTPPPRRLRLRDLIEADSGVARWDSPEQTQRLMSMMSDINLAKLDEAFSVGKRIVGTVYRRTRPDEAGRRVQRAEVRFDDVSGCLRTPAGGSSRQTILVVEGKRIRSRLLSPREAARLMGVPDSYQLPDNYNEAYHLMGDGLAVPVVAWIEKHLLRPLALAAAKGKEAA